jgi:hypothetical protein
LEKLKEVLDRQIDDFDMGINAPYDSEGDEDEEYGEEDIREFFELRKENKMLDSEDEIIEMPINEEETKMESSEEEEELDEDGEKLKSIIDLVLEEIPEDEDKEMLRMVFEYLAE